ERPLRVERTTQLSTLWRRNRENSLPKPVRGSSMRLRGVSSRNLVWSRLVSTLGSLGLIRWPVLHPQREGCVRIGFTDRSHVLRPLLHLQFASLSASIRRYTCRACS